MLELTFETPNYITFNHKIVNRDRAFDAFELMLTATVTKWTSDCLRVPAAGFVKHVVTFNEAQTLKIVQYLLA